MQISLTKSESYVRYFVITAIVSIGLTSSCKKHEAQHRPPADPTSIASPTITDFNPKVGYLGKPLTVTITGTNFSNDITGNTVSIGDGAQGRIVYASPTSLTVDVMWKKNSSLSKYPKLSGRIIVETKARYLSRRAQSASDFKIVQNDGNPDITGFRNQFFEQGAGGTLVIKGINFSSNPAENIVEIGRGKATVKNASSRLLEVELPAGLSADDFDVAVTVNGKKCNTGTQSGIYILNRHDVEQLRTFFNTRNGGKTHGELLETSVRRFQVINLDTWVSSQVAQFTVIGENRMKKFYLPTTNPVISGQLNLPGCKELALVEVSNHNLTSIDLSGASADLRLYCKGNQLTSIKLSHPLKSVPREYEKPEEQINPQQEEGTPDVVVTTTK